MSTSSTIGSISYNTDNFFIRTVKQLYADGLIDDYRAIKHDAESVDKKDHFHFILYPCKRINTYDLKKLFDEPDPFNEEPLKCLPFRKSEPLNWLLYVLHDADYLKSHSRQDDGDGKKPYELYEIVTPNRELLQRDFQRACHIRLNANQKAMEAAARGATFFEILSENPEINPIALNAILKGMYSDLTVGHASPPGETAVKEP